MLDGMRLSKWNGKEKQKTGFPAKKSRRSLKVAETQSKGAPPKTPKTTTPRIAKKPSPRKPALRGRAANERRSDITPEPRTPPQQTIIQIHSDIGDSDDGSDSIRAANPPTESPSDVDFDYI